jgi:hypothetical protein
MFNVNNLFRRVLISPAEVIYQAHNGHTLDPMMIQQSIVIAEERFIRPALGHQLYNEIALQKNSLVTTANQATLQAAFDEAQAVYAEPYVLKPGDFVNSPTYLSEANRNLWNEYLWKLTAEAVMAIALPEGFVQFASEGSIHKQPSSTAMSSGGTVTPGLQSMKWALDKKLMDRIDPLTQAMAAYLCRNKAIFPLYDQSCDCDKDGTAYQRKTSWITGIYDDEPEGCGCDA